MGWETLGDHGRLDWQSIQKDKQEKTNTYYLLFTTWPSPRTLGTSSEYPRHEYPKGQSPSRKQVRGVVSTCLHSLKCNNKFIEK